MPDQSGGQAYHKGSTDMQSACRIVSSKRESCGCDHLDIVKYDVFRSGLGLKLFTRTVSAWSSRLHKSLACWYGTSLSKMVDNDVNETWIPWRCAPKDLNSPSPSFDLVESNQQFDTDNNWSGSGSSLCNQASHI